MTIDLPILPLVPDFIEHLEARMVRDLAAVIQDWSKCASNLTRWEDEHLLDDPSCELLELHKGTIERLLRFGNFLSAIIQQPAFPDRRLLEIVTATQHTLQDKVSIWHTPMPNQERERILQTVFHEP